MRSPIHMLGRWSGEEIDGPQALMSIPVHYCNTVMTLRPKFNIFIFIGIKERLENSDSLEDCVAIVMSK